MKRLDAEQYHIPVMLRECIEALNLKSSGTYIDGTLGGGGHTAAILETLAAFEQPVTARLLSFDADEVAIEHCRKRFAAIPADGNTGPFLNIVPANFETMADVAAPYGPIDGVLLDLGVSSYQFDHHVRGFSYRMMAPLDMRFTPEGPTAADILNDSSQEELLRIFYEYGEDPSARRIVQAIVQRRTLAPFRTTLDMRDVIGRTIPPQHQAKTLARVFQALRIAVNDELNRLASTLRSIIPLMAGGGRIVVMSYHSLEDRIVKNTFRDGADEGSLSILTKRPVEADTQEVASNPRARSAKLRIAERIH